MTYISPAAKEQLKTIIDRIERLETEKEQTAEGIREVYAEAKGNGYDTKTLRTIVKLRKMDRDQWAEQEELLTIYMHALGMKPGPSEEA
jgi:uncharacterized protein (UPF0335 family)